AVELLFDGHCLLQQFLGFCRRQHLVVARLAGAEPGQVRRAWEAEELHGRTHLLVELPRDLARAEKVNVYADGRQGLTPAPPLAVERLQDRRMIGVRHLNGQELAVRWI